MGKIIIYEKPSCTTCKKAIRILKENGVSFEEVNYYIEPFTKNKLEELLKKMNMKPSELLRKNDKAYKELKLDSYDEGQILDLMLLNSDLIQRPIVEKGDRAILARPAERISELF